MPDTAPGTPDPPRLTDGRPVMLQAARSFDFTSGINGHRYRLFVSVPTGEPPPRGFPAFYMFDGNSSFAVASETLRARAPGDGLRPTVLVAIGYATDDPMAAMALRMTDLSTPATAAWLASLPFQIPGLSPDVTGGLDTFIRVLDEEVRPAVAGLAPLDPEDQAVFGHSLGGLAVLRMLFTGPDRFRTFAASSPSIWWAGQAVLADEASFRARVEAGTCAPRILLAAGGQEQTPDAGSLRFFRTPAEAQASADACRMVDNVRDLGLRLAAIPGAAADLAETVIFPDEGHGSVIPAALSRALQFALAGDGPSPGPGAE